MIVNLSSKVHIIYAIYPKELKLLQGFEKLSTKWYEWTSIDSVQWQNVNKLITFVTVEPMTFSTEELI